MIPLSASSDARADAAPAPPPGERGLSDEEALRRLRLHGPNRLVPERRRTGLGVWLLRPLTDPMAVLLMVAGGTYLALGDRLDAIVVLAALIPITLVTLVLEARSERALEQLKRLTSPNATVWRDGRRRVVPAETVVPGDLVFVREGDVVPADGALVGGTQLMIDESALTGESQPVEKDLTSEHRELSAGTTVLSGRGVARVTATGARTRYGQIGTLVAEIKQPATPLERAVRRLVLQLGAGAAVLCLALAALEIARGAGWAAAIIAGVSLAIAAVPEEFPMVYTLYLSLGAWRLARDKALVRRLAGVETLGATTVICADKTGTLTLGHLEVEGGAVPDGRVFHARDPVTAEERSLLEAAVLASEPKPFDVLEQAILRFAGANGVDVGGLHSGTLVRDHPFDPDRKYMSHVWRRTGGEALRICAKGALEGILARTRAAPGLRERMLAANERLASEGMRVIAVAEGAVGEGSQDRETDERALRFAGLVAFSDPVRPGVVEALDACRRAGVRVIMITGDHPVTAHAVADSLGLPHEHGRHLATGEQLDLADERAHARLVRDVAIFARTRPEQKYRIVRALRSQGHVVAMTGDGINDAPALREADIGVALGEHGTEVARAAATLVLVDDNFATIVNAVRNGRRIFDNLQRAFSYVIAFHAPLLLGALVVPLLGAPLLLLPVHLVWLELIVHPTASLVFEADAGAPDLMSRPPRPPGRGMLGAAPSLRPFVQGVVLAAGVLALYFWHVAQRAPQGEARAVALAALVLGQVGLVLVQRSPERPVWRSGLGGNPMLLPVVAATLATLVLGVYAPPVTALLKLAPLTPREWGEALATALVATLWFEPVKAWRARNVRPGTHVDSGE